jgi:uncharacterized surface protein with fasciclin (FAS1) repeats
MKTLSGLGFALTAAILSACAPISLKDVPATAPTPGTIVDVAVANGNFKTLATALTAAGLVDTLKGAGPFTVFAPTDAAFAKIPKATLDSLLLPANKDALANILKYHVVSGKTPASEVLKLNGKTVTTVQGQTITVNVNGSAVSLTDAKGGVSNVTITDVQASNGVIHVIDAVLMPK